MFGLDKNSVRKIVREELGNGVRKIVREELEKSLEKELEHYVDESRAKVLIELAIREKEDEFEKSWRVREETREETMIKIYEKIDNVVYHKLKEVVAEQANQVKDGLLVELARQAIFGGKQDETKN